MKGYSHHTSSYKTMMIYACLIVAIIWMTFHFLSYTRRLGDFKLFYTSSLALSHHLSPYKNILAYRDAQLVFQPLKQLSMLPIPYQSYLISLDNFNTPLMIFTQHLLIKPFNIFAAAILWQTFNLTLTIGGFNWLVRNQIPQLTNQKNCLLLANLFILLFYPIMMNLRSNSGSGLCLALILLAWQAGKLNTFYETIAIGVALGYKLFFASLILPFFKQKKWAIPCIFCVAFLLNLMVSYHLSKPLISDFFFSLHHYNHPELGHLQERLLSPANGSWWGSCYKLAYECTHNPIKSLHITFISTGILGSLFLLGFYFCNQKIRPLNNPVLLHDFYYAMICVIILAFNPLSWHYYFNILLLPIILIVKRYLENLDVIPLFLISLSIILASHNSGIADVQDHYYKLSDHCLALSILFALTAIVKSYVYASKPYHDNPEQAQNTLYHFFLLSISCPSLYILFYVFNPA